MVFASICVKNAWEKDSSLKKQKYARELSAVGHLISEYVQKFAFNFTEIV